MNELAIHTKANQTMGDLDTLTMVEKDSLLHSIIEGSYAMGGLCAEGVEKNVDLAISYSANGGWSSTDESE